MMDPEWKTNKKIMGFLALIGCAVSVALLVIWQSDRAYLYDVSFLHSTALYFIAAGIAIFTVIGLCIGGTSVFRTAKINGLVLPVCIFLVFFDAIVCPWVSSSQTNDMENYKKFDVQVQSSVYKFFPELEEGYDVVTYDYYYNYSYHHVYSIYLEIQVDGDIEPLLQEYRKDDVVEQPFIYDECFTEIVYEDYIDYTEKNDRLGRADVKKVLYSNEEGLVIFQCLQSWAYCPADEVYYFERFSIDPAEYTVRE